MHPRSSTSISEDGARGYLVWIAAGLVLLSLGAAGFVYLVDPFQVFRPSAGAPNFYTAVEYQIPGIARHYPFDAVVIGTSTSNNFTAADLRRVFGWRAVNFAAAGSTIVEQHAILTTALATGKVRHVFWGLDPFAFKQETNQQFPHYLYEGAGWRRVKYLWNLDALRHGFWTMTLPPGRRMSLERWAENNVWDHRYPYGREVVLNAWRNRRALPPEQLPRSPEEASWMVERFVTPAVASHPQTYFRIVLPPYTALYQQFLFEERRRQFDGSVWALRAVVEHVGSLPNVRVYDFRDATEITHDLDVYKDLVHFSGRMSTAIIEAVAAGRRLTTVEAFDRATERLIADAQRNPSPN